MGDGKHYSNSTTGIFHSYTAPGYYTIRAVGTNKRNKKAEAVTTIYITEGTTTHYSLSIQPSFTYGTHYVSYSFKPVTNGKFDSIVRSFNNKEETKKGPTDSVSKTFSENGKYTIRAKAYAQGELKAIASVSIQHSDKALFSYLESNNATLQQPASFTTRLIGIKFSDIQQIMRNRGDGETSTAKELTASHQYKTSGLKTIIQTVNLTNGQRLENIISIFVENSFKSQSMALNINGKLLSYAQNEPTNLSISLLPKTATSAISITTLSEGISKTYNNPTLSKLAIQENYTSMGQKSVATYGEINRCISLYNQGYVNITKDDLCYNARRNGTLSHYKCDMDKDGIPDICDDDIDGDGIKNLLGLIKYEKADCSYDSENLNIDLLRKHIGICSLDNCPFQSNDNQIDLNNNGI